MRRLNQAGLKGKYYQINLFLLLWAGMAQAQSWAGGYHSGLPGLEEDRQPPVYSMQTIKTLRRAVSPRYVRVLDWEGHGSGQPLLKKGILFTCAAYQANRVFLSGDFNGWNKWPMQRSKGGVFYHILPVREVEQGNRLMDYRYKFNVDGLWIADPLNPTRLDDGMGGSVSMFYLEKEDVQKNISVRILRETRPSREKLVEFAVYNPAANNISLVGNFNHWNPEHDIMQKDETGIFKLRMRLVPGEYVYKFIADGRWQLDPYNPNTRFQKEIRELCSYLKIDP